MRRQVGQTLLEILLAFSVSILVLSAVILSIITSLNNTQYTKNQGLANSYAQEGMAVIRKIKDSNLNKFPPFDDFTNNTIYCIGANPTGLPMDLAKLSLPNKNCREQSPVPAGGIFSREAAFERNSASCANEGVSGTKVAVKVSWTDNKCPIGTPLCHSVQLITCFSSIDLKSTP